MHQPRAADEVVEHQLHTYVYRLEAVALLASRQQQQRLIICRILMQRTIIQSIFEERAKELPLLVHVLFVILF